MAAAGNAAILNTIQDDKMFLRCRVVDGIWWVGEELVDGKKTIPMVPQEVVAFQGVDIRQNPMFYQIIPCPYCGTEDDRKHDLAKHVDTHLQPSENEPLWAPMKLNEGEIEELKNELGITS